ncbi:MAG: aldehyde:ferredoxin oxidoreductase, partial [Chloroflexi bacterium]|nr:aldehyde:ferredoxin oxidoreductase [Chloroflexota bacterium]
MAGSIQSTHMHGYHGRLLVIDLSSRSWREEALPTSILQAFVGGSGLASWLLYRFCPAGAEPFSPENPLIFVNSPLVGTSITTSSKYTVITKSPLTGFVGDSLSSSYLAVELKKTGYDAIAVTGQADTWTYVEIASEAVRFHDGSTLVGLNPVETEAAVRRELGDAHYKVAAIGVAGERLVRYATISNDGRHAGRTGTGAVMGSKRLKALAIRGSWRTEVAHPSELQALRRTLAQRSLGHATEKYRGMGTTANLSVFNRLAALPTRNFQQSTFEQADAISGEHLNDAHFERSVTCANCTIGCEHLFRVGDRATRMEYESLYALGPLCGVSNSEQVLDAAALCDRYGMDTISSGATVAWAMECAEKGLIDAPDLRFGSGSGLLAALEAVAS